MEILFKAIPTKITRAYQNGELDENVKKPELVDSDGTGNPCRHCLTEIPKGKGMLILNFRPLVTKINPYSETGPIFLCEDKCKRHADSRLLPAMFKDWEKILIRGYNNEGRIVYGTGNVIKMNEVAAVAKKLFEGSEVEYIHMRSASYNCYQCRIERAE